MQEEKSRHRKAFEEFVRRIKDRFSDSVESLVLYGSVVRGEETSESDVDVLVVVNHKDEDLKEEIIGIGYEILMKRKVYISPKVLSEEEYEKLKSSKSPFIENVEKEGEAVHV